MQPTTHEHINSELRRARTKFPHLRHQLDALVEKVGELAQALLQLQYEPGKAVTPEQVYDEAIQVAAMAIRVAEEGDSTYPDYVPPY